MIRTPYMRVAVINNGTSEPEKILDLLRGNEVTVFPYSKAGDVRDIDFDLLVLSGSSLFPIVYNEDKLAADIKIIRESTLPILGICYGCELIAIAFGGTLKDLGEKEHGILTVTVTKDDPVFAGRKEFAAYHAHRWIIDSLPSELEVLACSLHGPEVIRHTSRPIYGFQFHPEKMVDETYGNELFASFVEQQVTKISIF